MKRAQVLILTQS